MFSKLMDLISGDEFPCSWILLFLFSVSIIFFLKCYHNSYIIALRLSMGFPYHHGVVITYLVSPVVISTLDRFHEYIKCKIYWVLRFYPLWTPPNK